MRRIFAFSATAIMLSSAVMADDTGASDPKRPMTSDQIQLNAAGFLFDDSLREDGSEDREDVGDNDDEEDQTDDDRIKDRETSKDDNGQEDEADEDDD